MFSRACCWQTSSVTYATGQSPRVSGCTGFTSRPLGWLLILSVGDLAGFQCVSLWNISIDVKLVPWCFLVAGGCRECYSSAAKEDGYDILWYQSGTLDRRTCFNFHVKFLWRAVPNPRTTSPFSTNISQRFQTFFHSCTLAQSGTAVTSCPFFPISEINLHLAMATYTGYGDGSSDNLFGIYLEFEREGSAPNSNLFSDQDLMECVLHVRCIPHHNSIRQVWASVWAWVRHCSEHDGADRKPYRPNHLAIDWFCNCSCFSGAIGTKKRVLVFVCCSCSPPPFVCICMSCVWKLHMVSNCFRCFRAFGMNTETYWSLLKLAGAPSGAPSDAPSGAPSGAPCGAPCGVWFISPVPLVCLEEVIHCLRTLLAVLCPIELYGTTVQPLFNHVQPKFGTTVQHCSTPPRILNETSQELDMLGQREQCMMQYLVRICAEMCRDVQMSSSCAHENMWKTVQNNRRKFRSQTSDNMDRWKEEMGRVREEKREKKKEDHNEKVSEERRSRCTKGRKVAKHCIFPMFCGSGGSKSRLAVRSQLTRWEMKNCTPLWREAHLQVKKLKTPHVRNIFWSNLQVKKLKTP